MLCKAPASGARECTEIAAAQPQITPPFAPRAPSARTACAARKPAGGDAHDLLCVGDGGADHLRRAAVSFEYCKRALGVGGVHHVAEADAHVEDLEHLAVVDATPSPTLPRKRGRGRTECGDGSAPSPWRARRVTRG